MKFSSFEIKKELLVALNELGYYEPTRIQEAVLPKALKGNSFIAKSETGSGKTHSFLIPCFNRVNIEQNAITSIVISPTYELSSQTYEFASKIANKLDDVKVKLLSKNTPKDESIEALSYGNEMPNILFGTPGRLFDLIVKEKKIDISKVETLVFDEADMLLDEKYFEQIMGLINRITPKQKLIFTATMKEHLIADTRKIFGVNEVIDIDKKVRANKNITHHLVDIKHKSIYDSLKLFIESENPYLTMVFASKKKTVNEIFNRLNDDGFKCAMLNGEMPVRERKIIMKRIQNGEFNLIICSDIASRGIDLADVSTVISLDLPSDLDYYYHRAGRTGRNNKKGDSYIFYDDDHKDKLHELLKSPIEFDYLILRNEGLKAGNNIRNPKPKRKNEVLENKIKIAVSKNKSKKVKPNYKKKVRRAILKTKIEHKKEIVRKNIREKRKKDSLNLN